MPVMMPGAGMGGGNFNRALTMARGGNPKAPAPGLMDDVYGVGSGDVPIEDTEQAAKNSMWWFEHGYDRNKENDPRYWKNDPTYNMARPGAKKRRLAGGGDPIGFAGVPGRTGTQSGPTPPDIPRKAAFRQWEEARYPERSMHLMPRRGMYGTPSGEGEASMSAINAYADELKAPLLGHAVRPAEHPSYDPEFVNPFDPRHSMTHGQPPHPPQEELTLRDLLEIDKRRGESIGEAKDKAAEVAETIAWNSPLGRAARVAEIPEEVARAIEAMREIIHKIVENQKEGSHDSAPGRRITENEDMAHRKAEHRRGGRIFVREHWRGGRAKKVKKALAAAKRSR